MLKAKFMGVITGINVMISSLRNWSQVNKKATAEARLSERPVKDIKNGVEGSPRMSEGFGNWFLEATAKKCPRLFAPILKLHPPFNKDDMEVVSRSGEAIDGRPKGEATERDGIYAIRAFKANRCQEEDRLMYYQTCYYHVRKDCKRKFARLLMTSFDTNEESRGAFFETYYKPVKRRTLLLHHVSARKRNIAELFLASFGTDDEGKQAFCDVYYGPVKKTRYMQKSTANFL